MKCIYLINLLITIIIELYTIAVVESLGFENSMIKSIIIIFYSAFGKNITVICLYIA